MSLTTLGCYLLRREDRTATTHVRSGRVGGLTLAHRAVWIPVAVLVLRRAFFWVGAVTYSVEGLAGNHVNIYGDLVVHLGNATPFLHTGTISRLSIRASRDIRWRYHHLSDLTAAA